MLAALVATLLVFQEPKANPPAGDAKPAEAAAPAPAAAQPPKAPKALDDRAAKTAVADFQKAWKAASSMAAKNQALDSIAESAHKLLVKPLGQIVDSDKSVVIRKRAVELLAQQPAAEAKPEILRLLTSKGTQPFGPVLAALVAGLARTGYQSKDWAVAGKLFGQDYAADRVTLQEAILDLATQSKEKLAVDVLLENLDEPGAIDVHGADNPPAEYWEARWKAWKAWRSKVKDALFAITGQRFNTAAEAKAWLAKNPLK
jgi:hypothetical protein